MAQADMACHDAKARGRNRFNFYEASGQDQQQMEADIGWSQKIQKALADDALVVHFQSISSAASQPTTRFCCGFLTKPANWFRQTHFYPPPIASA